MPSRGACDAVVNVQLLSLQALKCFAVSWNANCTTAAKFLKRDYWYSIKVKLKQFRHLGIERCVPAHWYSIKVRLKQFTHLGIERCVSAHLISFSRLNFWLFENS